MEYLRNASELIGLENRLFSMVNIITILGTIEATYNDSSGETAAVNSNRLHFPNRTLTADFNP